MTKGTRTAVFALCVLASTGTAHAQTAQDKAGAEILFEEGKELMRQKKFAQACPKFLESNRLDTGLGTMLWLADCYDKNGQSASAWGEFREAMDIAARTHDPREKVARERSNKLEPTLSKLSIVVGPGSAAPGMVIKRDNVEVGQTLWGEAVPVDPGTHAILVTAPRKKKWDTTVQIIRGARRLEVQVPPLEDEPVPVSPVGPPPPLPAYTPGEDASTTPAPTTRSSGGGGLQRAVGGVFAGLGLAGEGAGVGLYFYATNQINLSNNAKTGHCKEGGFSTLGCSQSATAERNQAQNATIGEIISFVGGGVLIVTGVVLIVVAPSGTRSARLEPWFGPGGGGMSLGGTF